MARQTHDTVKAGEGEWTPMPEMPNPIRHNALDLAIRAFPAEGSDNLVKVAAKFEDYLRNGKEQKSE